MARKRVKENEAVGSLGLELEEPAPEEESEDRRNVVAFVRPGGPAAKAGIDVGDEIVKVDGHDVRGANSYLYYQLIRGAPGDEVTLHLAAGGEATVVLGPPE